MLKISKNMRIYHIGIDHTDQRRGSFSSSANVDVYGEPLNYIFGDEKKKVIDAVLEYLRSFKNTCLLHHFVFKTDRLNNYPFKFLVSLEQFKNQEPIIVFLQEE